MDKRPRELQETLEFLQLHNPKKSPLNLQPSYMPTPTTIPRQETEDSKKAPAVSRQQKRQEGRQEKKTIRKLAKQIAALNVGQQPTGRVSNAGRSKLYTSSDVHPVPGEAGLLPHVDHKKQTPGPMFV